MAATVIDANYILRWFLNDLPDQAKLVERLFAESAAASIVIDRVTITEVTYVLRSQGYDHFQIYRIFEELAYYPCLRGFEPLCQEALRVFRDTRLDFEDCLLVAMHRLHGYAVGSFDKKLLRLLNTG